MPPWGHLSQCRQEDPGPQGVQEVPEVPQLHLALGLPGRDGAWLTVRGREGAPVFREASADGQPDAFPSLALGGLRGKHLVTGLLAASWRPQEGTGPCTLA